MLKNNIIKLTPSAQGNSHSYTANGISQAFPRKMRNLGSGDLASSLIQMTLPRIISVSFKDDPMPEVQRICSQLPPGSTVGVAMGFAPSLLRNAVQPHADASPDAIAAVAREVGLTVIRLESERTAFTAGQRRLMKKLCGYMNEGNESGMAKVTWQLIGSPIPGLIPAQIDELPLLWRAKMMTRAIFRQTWKPTDVILIPTVLAAIVSDLLAKPIDSLIAKPADKQQFLDDIGHIRKRVLDEQAQLTSRRSTRKHIMRQLDKFRFAWLKRHLPGY